MKATIKTFESGAGDCIFLFLRNEEDNTSFHIMIDCNVLSDDVVDYITNALQKRLDVLVITHADSDHINGLTSLLRRADMQDLQINDIYFNCFQPQQDSLAPLTDKLKRRLEDLPSLLPPVIDEKSQKCSGMDAASFIYQLNKRPLMKSHWRKEPIIAGTSIPLGGSWGTLQFLSPSQKAMNEWFEELKIEFARKTGVPPLNEEFENQDMYYELMARMYNARIKKKDNIKTAACSITEESLTHYADIDAEEANVTLANKASLAFFWECNGKRVLFLGDSVSSTVSTHLDAVSKNEIFFEAIKIAHHGSKCNTSIEFCNHVNTCHLFLTGGKKGEGPHMETLAKFITKDVCAPENKHTLHYNHIVKGELLERLSDDDAQNLINSHSFYLTSDNEYTFEY